jgi:uncharacterized iron-regulated membrane protein
VKEPELRKWHRVTGLVIAFFAAVQVLTGIVLSVEDMLNEYWGGFIRDFHEGYGLIGNIYRIALGAALVWMIVSGMQIYRSIRQRTRSRR